MAASRPRAASQQHDFDPGRWGYSLANVAELLLPCLEALPARSVVEVGAYKGELTAVLLEWAGRSSATVAAVEPEPPAELAELAARHPELELVREESHAALARIDVPDAVIIDGDHNYWTLSEELRILAERAPAGQLPLLAFHDVGWPHARRDTYYAPERVPEEHRQPLAHPAHLAPGEAGVADAGLPYEWAAAREGGPRNGVLTALEDFTGGRPDLRLALVPAFFGFGVLWHRDAPHAGRLEEILGPWDRNPLLERLEANRVHHLVAEHVAAQRLDKERRRGAERDRLLRTLLESGAFALAERVSRLRHGGTPAFSRAEVRRALGEE
jgi:SAM-dependent methyltransferase